MDTDASVEPSCFQDPDVLPSERTFRNLESSRLLTPLRLVSLCKGLEGQRGSPEFQIRFFQPHSSQRIEDVHELSELCDDCVSIFQLERKSQRQHREHIYLPEFAVLSHVLE